MPSQDYLVSQLYYRRGNKEAREGHRRPRECEVPDGQESKKETTSVLSRRCMSIIREIAVLDDEVNKPAQTFV